jgi:hypothetical protein
MKSCDYYKASLSDIHHFIQSTGLLEGEIFERVFTIHEDSFGEVAYGLSSNVM